MLKESTVCFEGSSADAASDVLMVSLRWILVCTSCICILRLFRGNFDKPFFCFNKETSVSEAITQLKYVAFFNVGFSTYCWNKWTTLVLVWTIFRWTCTAWNTAISANILVWKLCGNAEFPQSFGEIARNSAKTVRFHKISTPGNWVKFCYFASCRRTLFWSFPHTMVKYFSWFYFFQKFPCQFFSY